MLERIDAAIAALQNVDPDKAPLAEPIIARLMAARRDLCASRNLYVATAPGAEPETLRIPPLVAGTAA
ncbi:MAG TPA: hypothetical protein VMV26_05795 [Alphaproteobacteria bacterium]|nr:hypothetical protein [Alphaproteobacteria bacterium]